MVFNILAFVAGLSLLYRLPSLPAPVPFFAVLVTFWFCLFWLRRSVYLQRALSALSVPLLCLSLGFGYGWLVTHQLLQQRLPEALFENDVQVTGNVAGSADRNGRRLRFLFRISSTNAIENPTAVSGALLRLSWYGTDAPDLREGDRLVLQVKLKRPAGFMNPGGFDYEKWLFQQRIVATGYVKDADNALELYESNADRRGGSLRDGVISRIRMASEQRLHQGLILALAVGERGEIEREQWQRFIDTGTNHLLAISGLHITLVATAAGLLIRLMWRYSKLLQSVQREKIVVCTAALVAMIYAAMAGFAVPTQRALIMFIVLAFFVLQKRHHRRLSALSIALLVVSLWNPLSVLSAGFWMSFCAVAVLYLIYSSVPRDDWRQKAATVLRGHLMITIGLYPATVLLFQQASLIAPVANFFSVPLVGLIITPIVFLCTLLSLISVDAAAALLIPVDYLLTGLSWVLQLLADLPLAIVRTGTVPMLVLLLVSAAALLALTPAMVRIRWLVLPLVLPLLFLPPQRIQSGHYKVTFLDVGQGTAVAVRTANRVLLYDTGAQFSRTFSAADAVIIPYLQSLRINTLDAVVVSHSDNDHSGGVDEITAQLQVRQLWHSQPLPVNLQPLNSSMATEQCHAGQSWRWDGVHFEFLHPLPGYNGNDNNLSCVLRVTAASGQVTLLAGDIEREVEARLAPTLEPVDILLAPHHGSSSSSSAVFVDALQPDYVVYTVGYNNRFGFPKAEVVSRYAVIDAVQLSTANGGATTFAVGAGDIRVGRYRADNPRIWRRVPDDVSDMTATLKAGM